MLSTTLVKVLVAFLAHSVVTLATPVQPRAEDSSTTAFSVEPSDISNMPELEFKQKAIADCLAAGGKPMWKPSRADVGNLSAVFNKNQTDSGPRYDDIIFDPAAAANPPEYGLKDGEWTLVKRQESPRKASLAQGAVLASLAAVVRMGWRWIAWLPTVGTHPAQPRVPWCATKRFDTALRSLDPSDRWYYLIKEYDPSVSTENLATSTGWYWPHYFYDTLVSELPGAGDKVGESWDDAMIYAGRVLARLTGAFFELALTEGKDASPEALALRKTMLSVLDDRPTIVGLKSEAYTGVFPAIGQTADQLVIYDYNNGQQVQISLDDVLVTISLGGTRADMFKDGALYNW